MSDIGTSPAQISGESIDVFAAAGWLDSLWNSSAKAVSAQEIEWQCDTWGSGHGAGDWVESLSFRVAAAAFGLEVSRNYAGRDELVVLVPLERFQQVADLIDRLGEDPETSPWFADDVEEDVDPITFAAEALGLPRSTVADNRDLLEALRLV